MVGAHSTSGPFCRLLPDAREKGPNRCWDLVHRPFGCIGWNMKLIISKAAETKVVTNADSFLRAVSQFLPDVIPPPICTRDAKKNLALKWRVTLLPLVLLGDQRNYAEFVCRSPSKGLPLSSETLSSQLSDPVTWVVGLCVI